MSNDSAIYYEYPKIKPKRKKTASLPTPKTEKFKKKTQKKKATSGYKEVWVTMTEQASNPIKVIGYKRYLNKHKKKRSWKGIKSVSKPRKPKKKMYDVKSLDVNDLCDTLGTHSTTRIEYKRKSIYNKLIKEFGKITWANFEKKMTAKFWNRVMELYDKYFFKNSINKLRHRANPPCSFKVIFTREEALGSKVLGTTYIDPYTNKWGKGNRAKKTRVQMTGTDVHQIPIFMNRDKFYYSLRAATRLIPGFRNKGKPVNNNGVLCTDVLECMLVTFEHEFVHALINCFCLSQRRSDDKGTWTGDTESSSGHTQMFMSIVYNTFNHTEYYHNITQPIGSDLTEQNFRLGETVVIFEDPYSFLSPELEGTIVALDSKNATIEIDGKKHTVPYNHVYSTRQSIEWPESASDSSKYKSDISPKPKKSVQRYDTVRKNIKKCSQSNLSKCTRRELYVLALYRNIKGISARDKKPQLMKIIITDRFRYKRKTMPTDNDTYSGRDYDDFELNDKIYFYKDADDSKKGTIDAKIVKMHRNHAYVQTKEGVDYFMPYEYIFDR